MILFNDVSVMISVHWLVGFCFYNVLDPKSSILGCDLCDAVIVRGKESDFVEIYFLFSLILVLIILVL